MKNPRLNSVFLGAKNGYREEFRELIANVRKDCKDAYIPENKVPEIVYNELRARHLDLSFYDIKPNYSHSYTGAIITLSKIMSRILRCSIQDKINSIIKPLQYDQLQNMAELKRRLNSNSDQVLKTYIEGDEEIERKLRSTEFPFTLIIKPFVWLLRKNTKKELGNDLEGIIN